MTERRFVRLLAAQAVLLAALYAAVGIQRYVTYRATGFDLGLFDQVVWHYGHLRSGASSLKDLHAILGDHFSPILIVLAPLGALSAGPIPLIVAQALLIAASVVPVVLFARPRLGERGALLLGVGYGLFCGVQSAVGFDVHEVCFAPLLLATGVLLADRGRWRAALACVLALLLVKEDLSFLVVAFGAWFALEGRRREALICVAAGAAWYAVVSHWVIPHYAHGHDYGYWSYGDVAGWFGHLARKAKTVLVLFGAFLFVPLGAIEALLSLPLLAERMLSSNANYWTLHDHYSLTIAPVLALGFARRAPGPRACTAVALIGVASRIPFSLGGLFAPQRYRVPPVRAGAARVVDRIPAGAGVTATNHLVPHLAERDDIRLFGPAAPSTEYVAVESRGSDPAGMLGFASAADRNAAIARLPREGYTRLLGAQGVELWRRVAIPSK